jgi:hypothetical protein
VMICRHRRDVDAVRRHELPPVIPAQSAQKSLCMAGRRSELL